MMKTYSHIRRQALDAAAAALEPSYVAPPQSAQQESPTRAEAESQTHSDLVTSQSTSQSRDPEDGLDEFAQESGSSGWTRTSNPPVNSRMLCH
jgi:hypothetical protein